MSTTRRFGTTLALLLGTWMGHASPLAAQKTQEKDKGSKESNKLDASTLSGLELRNIGPAFMSGRVIDIAVDPADRSTWYVAAASGGVWKTENAGTTWKPIFDKYGSYSIGSVTVDSRNHLNVWVGTGENNSQRSVGFGDGIYKSVDGGRSFQNVGLKDSEHIGMIAVDPRNSNVVFAAAQGPLWRSGGDRGLYKTTDGGNTWERILQVSDDTGISEVYLDPRDPEVMYAVAYQRRRHVWVLLDGGPESGLWKSTDGGTTWKKINKGLPSGDKGRIGLALSPQKPDVLYAIVEASGDAGGVFRSEDAGEHWSKKSGYVSSSPQYYQELVADPARFDRIYSMDTFLQVSDDGGKTWRRMPGQWKHVDHHDLIVFRENPEHLLTGNDGGLYESWDGGESWRFFGNLPIAQFYKVAVSNDEPFYWVYGGTQDNNTQGGPSRTNNVHGIRNSDWLVTLGGDGFDPAVDPDNPDIIYSQLQYGNLVRYDRKTGEQVDIKPQEDADGPPLRWNWNSALIVSPNSSSRLYFGAQILFRSDDRGNSWRPVSPDLTRDLDRNQLKIMGRVWSVDAVAKNRSTSPYGTIVALTESPLVEDLLYAGTDDGLIQVTEDGGQTWRRIEHLAGVPDTAYISDLEASWTDPNTVYATVDNHKRGDFRPYVLKSTDRGQSWESIAGDLPERGTAYTIVADDETPDLLFVGTEYGIWFSAEGGGKWVQLKGGMPTIAVRELEIQRREDDLVAASFGRGFFILDNYSPLRELVGQTDEVLQSAAHIFPIKKAWMYVQARPFGGGEKAQQGAGFFTAPNPPFGATFTYYLKESVKTRKERRQEREKKVAKEGGDVFYPPWDSLKAEDREEKPAVLVVVRDEQGNVVRRVPGSTKKGVHRATWDFRYAAFTPSAGGGGRGGGFGRRTFGPMAVPGAYTVSLEKIEDGGATQLVGPTPFEAQPLGLPALPAADREALFAFQRQTGELLRAVIAGSRAAQEASGRLKDIKKAVEAWPGADLALRKEARALELRLMDLGESLSGDPTKPRRSEPAMPGISARVQQIVRGSWSSTSAPTQTHRENLKIASEQFAGIVDDLKRLIETDLPALEAQLDAAGVPWTSGRKIPDWPPQ